MIDREKVIKGLEYCIDYMQRVIDAINEVPCNGCPYIALKPNAAGQGDCIDTLFRDALALLKAQEPCEDWISRKRLKDEIQYYIDEAGWGEEVNKALGWCLEFIDNQRAVKWDG